MVRRQLHVLLEWVERHKLETRVAEDGESLLLLRRVLETYEVVAVTRHRGHTVHDLQALHDYAEGARALRHGGYRVRTVVDHLRLWRPGEIALYDEDDVEVWRLIGAESWEDAVREALAWAALAEVEDRILLTALEA